MKGNNYVFIMAGGVGSRFWPKSRNSFPKQFIDILGTGHSLLQITYNRFLKLCPAENIYIVTNLQYKDLVAEQLQGIVASNILCEPSRNNTAPCIAYAAFRLAAKDPYANMVVAPSDHFILYEDIFIEKIQLGLNAVSKEEILLTLGITPTRPDTGYGYIKFNKTGSNGIHKVNSFMEKPPLEKAMAFLAAGDYIWNGGIFIWNLRTILTAFQLHAPDIYNLFMRGKDSYNTPNEELFINEYYPQSPNISIDYAIMEKANNVYTIPADFGWSDLGTWASLYEVAEKVENSNVISASDFQLKDTESCIIHIPDNKLAIIRGLKDYIVVDDNKVLLIYPKAKEQEMKNITEGLKSENKLHYL